MKKGKSDKKKKKISMGFLSKLAIAAVMVYAAVSLITTQVEIVSKKNQLEEVHHSISETTQRNQELERILNSGEDSEFIERVAREKLGYAAPGERVFADASGS